MKFVIESFFFYDEYTKVVYLLLLYILSNNKFIDLLY